MSHTEPTPSADSPVPPERSLNFIEQIVEEDLRTGKHGGSVQTRFPPEPNGYLHIGHAKSICLNFGLAKKYGGRCNLRFDDTNPTTEDTEYVDSIQNDVRWLGFQWDGLYYASDYFEQLYQWAEKLIHDGLAYVDSQSGDEISKQRGTSTAPGVESPFRSRSVAENLDLFRRMRAGEFPDGAHVLRAKMDMASTHLMLRDPVLYRIRHAHHHRTGDKWCIYPLYDYAHGQCDSIEQVTHSICTLEFETHRRLYDWFIEKLGIFASHQYEFARLNLSYTIMSKRRLLELVKGGFVEGWDDPRMPTLCGLRRRGYTPEALRAFCDRIGVARFNSTIEMAWLEDALRDDLNKRAPRAMAVLRPLKVVLTNWPDEQVDWLDAVNNPEDESAGTHKVPFGKTLYIEQDDFMESPPKQFFRLAPGREVRLRYGYLVTCQEVVKDTNGEIVELRCTYDPASRGGNSPDGRKVKATMHWVSAEHAIPAEVRLYDHLCQQPDPNDVPDGADWKSTLNPTSLDIVPQAWLEPSLANAAVGSTFQFERLGYFCVDRDRSSSDTMIFNRAVTLRDSWAKAQKKEGQKP